MVPPQNIHEKYNEVRQKFCFYLDIQDNEVARSLSKRIEDLGLVQEVFLTSRVSHVVREGTGAGGGGGRGGSARRWAGSRDGPRGRADAMLQRVRDNYSHRSDISAHPPPPPAGYVTISVQKAILILDKIYDTFFSAPDKFRSVCLFQGHFIKIEFLDKLCRPVFKEFDVWPEISLEPDLPKEKEVPVEDPPDNNTIPGGKMTRKSRPRIKEKDEKDTKGYCEMCNTEYANATLHRRSPHHLAFVRDQTNFLALDSLIGAGADVATFLDKTAPLNGERRSLRIMCNGDSEPPKQRRGRRSQSPTPANGVEARPRRVAEASAAAPDDRQYYKVVGVSTKLRSSGGFVARRRDSLPPPMCNGAEPLVVKFRRVRRSELSVLSDEAEQFMFPKRASSTSSTSSDDDDEMETKTEPSPSVSPRAQPSPALERRRLARPLALKEESSEEDSWPEDRPKRRRKGPGVARRGRPAVGRGGRTSRAPVVERTPPPQPPPAPPDPPVEPVEVPAAPEAPPPAVVVTEEPTERCMKWENGRLNYTPAVEQLEFAFERVPCSEPWFETFQRQDQDKVITKNVPQYFALYSKSPKLPYEIGHLPPLKPNCCPLSDLVKRESGAGATGSATRGLGMRGRKRHRGGRTRTVAALLALEAHPRKSPREHASTLAILGSAGLLHRRRHAADDAKSTASEDTLPEALAAAKHEAEVFETSERVKRFLSEVFEDVADYDVSDDAMEGDTPITTSTNAPDLLGLVSEAESCDTIRDEIKDAAPARVASTARRSPKFKKKNRTGWPNKKKSSVKRDDATAPAEPTTDVDNRSENDADRSSAERADSSSETEEEIALASYTETLRRPDAPAPDDGSVDSSDVPLAAAAPAPPDDRAGDAKSDSSLRLDVKVLLRSEDKLKTEHMQKVEDKNVPRPSTSEGDEADTRRASRGGRRRGAMSASVSDCKLLQPVVRVARVDGPAARTLRSAGRGRPRSHRLR